MARELRGTRYLTRENEPLKDAILNQLPYMDFYQTLRFYGAIDKGIDDRGRALLNCNDRFYLLTVTCHRRDAWHPWVFERCREVEKAPDDHLDLWARGHYKDLMLETPVLTTNGWSTHGALKLGDHVFSPSGKPVKVLATRHFSDSACRRITFDNGISFVCGAGHLWTVDVPSRQRVSGTKNGRVPRKSLTLTTDEISKQKGYRPIVRATLPLEMPHADLPIDPYVLGAWLGDGTSSAGSICGIDPQIFSEIAATGERVGPSHVTKRGEFKMRTIYGMVHRLRLLGVLNNKHIPECYMMASADQRLSLLQGLIDTDGSISPDNGCVTFAQSDRLLSEQVRTLANSLGFKARLTPARTTNSWHVVFQVSIGDRPCRLKRKLALLNGRHRCAGSKGWRVHSVESVESVPTNCIEVDSDDGLYLVGKELVATHNSSVGTFAGVIQEILIDPEITIAIMSGTNKIAIPFLTQIQMEFENNDDMKRIHSDVLWDEPRKQAPLWARDKGIIVKRKGNPKEATVEAFGVIDGMRTGRHFDLLDFDDLIDESMVDNPDIVKKVTQRWELAGNLGRHTKKTRKWHWGTRYSYQDTYGVLLERGVLKERRYPATHDGTLNGDPVMMKREEWDKLKLSQRSTVNAQMLLNPLAGNESTFEMTKLKHYDVIPSILNVYILIDPSKGATKRSDRTAIAVVGIDVGGNKYLLDGYCHRMKLSERYRLICQLKEKWENHPGVQMVKVGYERYGMQSDVEVIGEYQERDKNYFEIIELNTPRQGGHAKNDRIERLEPDFNHAKFFLPHVVYHPEFGGGLHNQALWEVWTQDDFDRFQDTGNLNNPAIGTILYRPMGRLGAKGSEGLSRNQRAMEATGQSYRIVTALKRRNEDGDMYDLTRVLMEEVRLHPFAPHDDLLDALSRIYDIEPMQPIPFEGAAVAAIEHPDS